MILVDTSIRIDHLHAADPALATHLVDDDVGTHPAVIEELALGSIKNRAQMLYLLVELWQFPAVSHTELLHLVDTRHLWARGLTAVDARLLGSVALVPGARLWPRDQRLRMACDELGLASIDR